MEGHSLHRFASSHLHAGSDRDRPLADSFAEARRIAVLRELVSGNALRGAAYEIEGAGPGRYIAERERNGE